jgi:hypothetical protein
MKLPIDTSAITFLAASPAEPVVDFDTRQPRVGDDGRPLYSVSLVALSGEGADVIPVKTAGELKGLAQGTAVKVTGLVATPWTIGDRSGVSFRAERIELQPGSRQA